MALAQAAGRRSLGAVAAAKPAAALAAPSRRAAAAEPHCHACAPAAPCAACGGHAPDYFSQRLAAGPIRGKLAIGAPSDPAEREAERVAEALTRPNPAPLRPRPSAPAWHAPAWHAPASDAPASGAPAASPVLPGAGRELDAGTRAYFEPRFGRDLSATRIHTDAAAGRAAQALRTRAFAAGPHIAFAPGAYAPQTRAGRHLLAHELAHVAQGDPGMIRRAPPEGAAPTAPPAPPPVHKWPTTGETVTFKGVELTENPDQLTEIVTNMMAGGLGSFETMAVPVQPGLEAPWQFLGLVAFAGNVTGGTPCTPDDADYDMCHRNEVLRTKIVPVLSTVVQTVTAKAEADVAAFKEQALKNARDTLEANRVQTRAEGIRYGLTEKQIDTIVVVSDGMASVGVPSTETEYGMDADSPSGKGLKLAAEMLLKRRAAIEQRQSEQSSHVRWVRDPYDSKGRMLMPDDQYAAIGVEIDGMIEDYNKSRTLLSSAYPALAAFSEYGKSTADLQSLATKGPGPTMAGLLGAKIAETLGNIAQARRGLDDGDINIWRVEKIIDVTRVQLGVDTDPVRNALISEKVKHEQPGILASLALLVFNIAAILLAGVTGGLSLVAAAGVNAYVTAGHVQDYLLQKAMVGSAFDKANALSKEEPSLFWLAVEVIGTAVDVGTAAVAAFKTLAPLVRAALAAKEVGEAAETVEAVRIAATRLKDADTAERVLAQIRNAREGEGTVVKGLEEESKLLQGVGKAADAEAAVEIGEGLASGGRNFHVSKAGHVFTCASPCTELAAKYADIFAKDEALAARLSGIERDAKQAAELQKAGKLAEAEQLAGKAKNDAAALENSIKEAYPPAPPVPLEPEVEAAIKQAQSEAATKLAVEGVAHEAPKLLSVARIAAATQKLGAKFPVLLKLKEGAIERIVRAGFAVSETGGLRAALRWPSAVRGQLLEEIASVRIRGLLGTAEGRLAMGLEKDAADLVYIEGSRIRDAAGLQLSDGMVVRRLGDRVEIVAVMESKAGAWAAGGLSEGLQGLKRMSALDLLEGIRAGGARARIIAADAGLADKLTIPAIEALDDAGRLALRDRMLAAINTLPEADLRPLKTMMQTGEGQVSRDIERLMEAEDRTVQLQIHDGAGKPVTVTAQLPKRPRFLGAVPTDVAVDDIAKTLGKQGFGFGKLDLGEMGMTRDELVALSKAIIGELGPDLEAAANLAAKAP